MVAWLFHPGMNIGFGVLLSEIEGNRKLDLPLVLNLIFSTSIFSLLSATVEQAGGLNSLLKLHI